MRLLRHRLLLVLPRVLLRLRRLLLRHLFRHLFRRQLPRQGLLFPHENYQYRSNTNPANLTRNHHKPQT
jgi:hypothetical protein